MSQLNQFIFLERFMLEQLSHYCLTTATDSAIDDKFIPLDHVTQVKQYLPITLVMTSVTCNQWSEIWIMWIFKSSLNVHGKF